MACIQFAIMAGAALGGFLIDATGTTGAFPGSAAFLVVGAILVGDGARTRPPHV